MSELKVHARSCDIEPMVHIEEVRAAFASRLKKALDHNGFQAWGAGARLAHLIGVTPKATSKWLNGEAMPGGAKMHALAAALRVRIEWLEYGRGEMTDPDPSEPDAEVSALERPSGNATMLGPISVWDDDTPLDDDEVYVPFLKEVELSAGSGRTVIEKSSSRKLRFGKMTLRRQGVQFDQAVCVTVHGNSMEPVLPDGSTVGVDRGSVSVKDGKMYAIDHGGELRVKTLYRIPGGGLRFRSFNQDEHPDEEYTAQQLAENAISVLGKVFWYSVLL